MPKDSTSDTWIGAPPVSEDGFAYAHGEFFAKTSGHNRHRRATPAELKTHFTSGSDRDHPAHWFEAQLLHYGLPPSKTKSVARMRLFDAVNAGKLKVPTHVAKLEGKLKKDWTKNDREAKKAHKGGDAAPAKKPTAGGAKRKASEDDAAAAKKTKTVAPAKTTKATASASKTKAAAPKAKPGPKPAAKPTANPAAKSAPEPAPETKPPKRCFARRGGISQGPSRGTPSTAAATSPPRLRTKQTARRSAPFMRGRMRTPPPRVVLPSGIFNDYPFPDSPPPYSEYPEDHDSSGDDDSDDSDEDNDDWGVENRDVSGSHSIDPDIDPNKPLLPLGLLNGDYDISSRYIASEWPDIGSDLSLTLTLDGPRLWGRFDLGAIEGVLLINERPRESSVRRVPFIYRGKEDDGPVYYGNSNEGWIRFLGGGRIQGYFDYQGVTFRGERVPRQGTTSRISASRMQDEWSGYSEREYERQNRARWGGSWSSWY